MNIRSGHAPNTHDPACVCVRVLVHGRVFCCSSTMPFREIAKAVTDASAHASVSRPRSLTFRPVHTGPAEIAAPMNGAFASTADDDTYDADSESRALPHGIHVYTEPVAVTVSR